MKPTSKILFILALVVFNIVQIGNCHAQELLISEKYVTSFSNEHKSDTFKIAIFGNTLVDGTVEFSIISHNGIEIYHVTFSSKYLIGYELITIKNPTRAQEEEVITDRISGFFSSDNFSNPAIDNGDIYDSDYSDKSIWDEIIADSSAIGFYYKLGEGDGRWIAYSKKRNKVVIYYNCC